MSPLLIRSIGEVMNAMWAEVVLVVVVSLLKDDGRMSDGDGNGNMLLLLSKSNRH